MKTLIAEDDFTSRLIMQKILTPIGETHLAMNGLEAVQAVRASYAEHDPYDLICLDIMMPEMDGLSALREIREIEQSRGMVYKDGIKIVMTTALSDMTNVRESYSRYCDGYLVKPILSARLFELLTELGLLTPSNP